MASLIRDYGYDESCVMLKLWASTNKIMFFETGEIQRYFL